MGWIFLSPMLIIHAMQVILTATLRRSPLNEQYDAEKNRSFILCSWKVEYGWEWRGKILFGDGIYWPLIPKLTSTYYVGLSLAIKVWTRLEFSSLLLPVNSNTSKMQQQLWGWVGGFWAYIYICISYFLLSSFILALTKFGPKSFLDQVRPFETPQCPRRTNADENSQSKPNNKDCQYNNTK